MITRNAHTDHRREPRWKRSRTILAMAAAGAGLTLVMAACSSTTADSSSSSDKPAESSSAATSAVSGDSSAAQPPAQGITDSTIKIGVLGPFSGNASVYSKATDLAMSIYKDANANGGINGRQIEIVSADTKCDAATLQGIIRKFVEQDKVFMISGGSCSNAIIAAKPLIEQYGIPMVTMNAASAKISDPPLANLFHVKATSEEQADAIAAFVASNPDAKTVAFAATSDEWGQTGIAPVKSMLEKAAPGVNIATDQQLDPEGADPTPAIRKMIDVKPDMAVVFAYPQPMTTFLKNARPQGLTVPVVTGDGTRPDEQANRLGSRKSAENFFSVFGFTKPFDDPSHDKYKTMFTKDYPNLDWDTVALEGAASAEFNVAVLKAMGTTMTWENFIHTAEITSVDSVSGTLQFAPFDVNNKLTRRPGIKPNFSVLDPHDTGEKTIVVTDWADWLKVKG
jgi:branched-chain amino acid transport system substrate-binding protein